MRPLPPALLRDEPWANGAGRTTVLACAPNVQDWRWRFSIAHIETEAAFSDYPDCTRQLAPLDAPLSLQFGAQEHTLQRLQVLRFAGTPAPRARLPAGPTRAANLITRGDLAVTLLARPLVGAMLLPQAPQWLLYLLAGRASVCQSDDERALQAGDGLMLGGAARLSGTGEVLLLRFD